MSRPVHTQLWLLPGRSSIARLHKQLQGIAGLKAVNSHNEQFLFLDSFDWRLYRKGWILQASPHGEKWLLSLIEAATGKLLAAAPVDSLPELISDIPAGILSNRLYKPLYPRALSPVCELRLKRHKYIYLNDEGKQYLRLFLDQPQAYLPNQTQGKKLPNCLVVEPVKGYEKKASTFTKILVKEFDLVNKKTSLLTPCLAAWKIETTFKDSKDRIKLNHDESACLAVSRVFSSFLETMRANEAGLINQVDSEFLHDFRIAVRRTRSLLGQVKKVFPEDKREEFIDEYAWLSTLTGPARDYDVMLLEFSDYQAMLPGVDVSGFAGLKEFLKSKQKQAYDCLIEALQSKRYEELNKNWRDFLASDFCQVCEFESRQTIQALANKRIAHVYTRAISEGKSITPTSPVEEFHRLRKTCKKLRYLMEIFRNLYSTKNVKISINELKNLQDVLGELQDLEVHIDILQDFLLQKYPGENSQQKSEGTVQQLTDKMRKRKLTVQNSFQARFDSFASKKNTKMFADLLGLKKI